MGKKETMDMKEVMKLKLAKYPPLVKALSFLHEFKDHMELLASKVGEIAEKLNDLDIELTHTLKDLLFKEFEIEVEFAKRIECFVLADPLQYEESHAAVLFTVMTVLIGQLLDIKMVENIKVTTVWNTDLLDKMMKMRLKYCTRRAKNTLIALDREEMLAH